MTGAVTITATVRMVDNDWWKGTAPDLPATVRTTPACPALILADTDGAPLAAVSKLPDGLAEFRSGALAYPCDSGVFRGAGVRNRARVFGYLGRSGVLRRAACQSCSGASEYPDAHARIAGAAAKVADLLADLLPDQHAANRAAVAEVLPEWLLPGGLWTSGVLNETSQLPYHRDRNNFPGAWSAMPVVRRHTRGGHLHLPELQLADGSDVVVACDDGDVVMFEGTRWMHGVTPIRKVRPDGYRFSCVYYPVRRFRNCLPWADERARGLASRAPNEESLIARQTAAGYLQAETASLGVHDATDDEEI